MLRIAATLALAAFLAPVEATADADQAERLGDAGKRAYRNGSFDSAAEAFEAAYEANDLPKYRFNAAKSWEKHGDLARAIAAYQDYLDLFPEAEDAEDVQTTVALLDYKLRKSSGLVRLTTTPAGATFVLRMADERRTGSTPRQVWAADGHWSLRLEKLGYEAVEREVVILAGVEQEIHTELTPSKGSDAAGSARSAPRTSEGPDRFGMASWSSFAVAGAALVGGALLTAMSVSKLSEYREYVDDKDDPGHTRAGADKIASSAEGLAGVGVALFGVAGIAATTGFVIPMVQGTW